MLNKVKLQPRLTRDSPGCYGSVSSWAPKSTSGHFDGWDIPNERSAIAEVYPALWKRPVPADSERSLDQQDAFNVAKWLSWADRLGYLHSFLEPNLNGDKRKVARLEGWILGVPVFPPPFR